jgi:hypothetical protein
MRFMRGAYGLPLMVALFCGCTPALDWRQLSPPEWGVSAMFPCRPSSLARHVALPTAQVEMRIYACSADGNTYALGALMLDDVRGVAATLADLRVAAARNLGAAAPTLQPFEVPGMTPNTQAGRATLQGRRPDGSAVTEHVLLFARGAQLYQATVVGNTPPDAAVSTFFGGLTLRR